MKVFDGKQWRDTTRPVPVESTVAEEILVEEATEELTETEENQSGRRGISILEGAGWFALSVIFMCYTISVTIGYMNQ